MIIAGIYSDIQQYDNLFFFFFSIEYSVSISIHYVLN